ncbi:MAG: hypothetical protein JXA99_02505 [Candidatus Lokiarchaeota archaeon]|nr:hypothetical protein [Candidatus Lokiarchaeota archaeon]
MKKEKSIKLVLLFFVFFQLLQIKINPVLAIAPLPYEEFGSSNTFPINDNNCTLLNATILYHVEYPLNYPESSRFNITTIHYYTVYNNGSECNMTFLISLPLGSTTNHAGFNVQTIPFQPVAYIDQWHWIQNDEFSSYFSRNSYNNVIFRYNITLPEKDSIIISIGCMIEDVGYMARKSEIYHDLFTSNHWNSIIYEKIEIQIFGTIPSYVSKDENLEIFDYQDNRSYIWTWNNEDFDINSIYIGFKYDSIGIELFGYILLSLVIITTYFIFKNIRGKKFKID